MLQDTLFEFIVFLEITAACELGKFWVAAIWLATFPVGFRLSTWCFIMFWLHNTSHAGWLVAIFACSCKFLVSHCHVID